MRGVRNWMLVLGLAIALPPLAHAGGMSLAGLFGRGGDETASRPALHPPRSAEEARLQNQQAAHRIGKALQAAGMQPADLRMRYLNGHVTLVGNVRDASERQAIERIVSTVEGVTTVENRLAVGSDATDRPPSEGKASANRRPRKPAYASGLTLGDLLGIHRSSSKEAAATEPAPQERPRQEWAARTAENPRPSRGGVQHASFEQAAPRGSASPGQAASGEAASNQETALAVAEALAEAGLNGYDIEVRVRGGSVLLGGQVGSPAEWRKASAAASHVPGVRTVRNRLMITRANPAAVQTVSGVSQEERRQPLAGQERIPASPAAGSSSPTQAAQPGAYGPPPATQFSGAGTPATSPYGPVATGPEGYGAAAAGSAPPPSYPYASVPNPYAVPPYAWPPYYAGNPYAGNPYAGNPYAGNPYAGNPYAAAAAGGYGPWNAAGGQGEGAIRRVSYQQPQQPSGGQPGQPYEAPPNGGAGGRGASPQGGPPMAAPSYGHAGPGAAQPVYDLPNLPNYAWPTYASYPNSAQISYPQQYSASAWPYIGPFYPYPQIPMGWRQVQLEWDDGSWNLNFKPRTDKWWWFVNPKNW